jgi:hypothetical protein
MVAGPPADPSALQSISRSPTCSWYWNALRFQPPEHLLLAKHRKKTRRNRYILTFLLFWATEIADP